MAIQYNLDNAGYKKVLDDHINFTVLPEGTHTITYFSTDKAGNNEPAQTISFEIVKPKTLPKWQNDCKNNGWKIFGRIFRNQNDCDDFSYKINKR